MSTTSPTLLKGRTVSVPYSVNLRPAHLPLPIHVCVSGQPPGFYDRDTPWRWCLTYNGVQLPWHNAATKADAIMVARNEALHFRPRKVTVKQALATIQAMWSDIPGYRQELDLIQAALGQPISS